MYQGTAPTLILPVEGMDLTDHTVQVTFCTSTKTIITRSAPDIAVLYENGDSFILIPFSQEETLQMPEGVCQVEVRSVNPQGVPFISLVSSMDVVGSLTKNVMQYQGGNKHE